MSCIRCNRPLFPVMLGPDSPPWVCPFCHRGWWVAELEAHREFRREFGDFGYGLRAKQIRATVEAERAVALERGTSVRDDQVHLLPTFALAQLPPSLSEHVARELARRDIPSPPSV